MYALLIVHGKLFDEPSIPELSFDYTLQLILAALTLLEVILFISQAEDAESICDVMLQQRIRSEEPSLGNPSMTLLDDSASVL